MSLESAKTKISETLFITISDTLLLTIISNYVYRSILYRMQNLLGRIIPSTALSSIWVPRETNRLSPTGHPKTFTSKKRPSHRHPNPPNSCSTPPLGDPSIARATDTNRKPAIQGILASIQLGRVHQRSWTDTQLLMGHHRVTAAPLRLHRRSTSTQWTLPTIPIVLETRANTKRQDWTTSSVTAGSSSLPTATMSRSTLLCTSQAQTR